MMDLKGKIALITGASRGIGAQIAEELASRGADLFITWSTSERSKESAANVMKRIRQTHARKICGIGIDLSLSESPAMVVKSCLQTYEHIDILVNNAGALLMASASATSLEDYQFIMNLNLRAPFLMVQASMPHLRKPARIINISSIAARSGFAGAVVYSMSKAGLEGMTRSMAKAFGGDGTTVNAVAPGVVQTEMLDDWTEEDIAAEAASTPVQHRNGTPDDIAQVVAWLAGEKSRWISGQTISACGAAVMY